jgi:hypothetical protein
MQTSTQDVIPAAQLVEKGKVEPTSDPTNTAAKPPNPFDLDSLALPQAFTETVGVQKLLTHVPVGKPGNQDWSRVHPNPEFQRNFLVLILRTEREVYLVKPEMLAELAGECVGVTMYTTISSQGVLRLWPVRLPGPDGKDLAWWSTEREAAERAKKQWVRINANMALGANEIRLSAMTAEPIWPAATFQEIIEIAFVGRLIDNVDHVVIKRLRGLM